MIKGINRNVIVVRTGRRSAFEAVLFIPRRGIKGRDDMLREANKIVANSGADKRRRTALLSVAQRLLWVLCGAVIGAGGAVAVCLMFLL